MNIPRDPFILLSYVNTKLRDRYPSLEEMCSSMDIDIDEIETKLRGIGYVYNPETNQFS